MASNRFRVVTSWETVETIRGLGEQRGRVAKDIWAETLTAAEHAFADEYRNLAAKGPGAQVDLIDTETKETLRSHYIPPEGDPPPSSVVDRFLQIGQAWNA